MKRRTSIQYNLQDHVWGVHPISIQCERDYQTQFQLYFQKSLQIISQHQTSQPRISKGEVVYFGPPQNIQPFRVQSDKNMDYKWSLYIKRKDFMGNNEQFLESIHINLKEQWMQYKDFRKNCYKREMKFDKMKINFSFLIIIAINSKDIEEAAQKYLLSPNSEFKSEGQKPYKSEADLTLMCSVTTDNKNNNADKQFFAKRTSLSSFVEVEAEHSQKSDTLSHQPAQNSAVKSVEPQFLQPSSSPSKLQNQNNKLSNSDLQIGNQIEEIVQTIQNKKSPQSFLKLLEEDSEKNKVEKPIRMTSSQLLDSQGVPIVPFYKRKSFILVVLALILLTIGHLLLKDTQSPIKKKDVKQKKPRKSQTKEGPVRPKKKKSKARV